MITELEARSIALEEARLVLSETDRTPEIINNLTRTEPFGWVFFYDSVEFVRTGDIESSLLGNSPIIVDTSGQIHHTGTAYPVDHYITFMLGSGELKVPDGAQASE